MIIIIIINVSLKRKEMDYSLCVVLYTYVKGNGYLYWEEGGRIKILFSHQLIIFNSLLSILIGTFKHFLSIINSIIKK